MLVGFIESRIRFLRPVELLGGIGSVLLGVAILLRILSIDLAAGTSWEPSSYFLAVLMFVVPAVLFFVGSYVQVVSGKRWALGLVLIGGVFGLIFVGANAGFGFLYIGDKRGQLAVLADLGVIMITIGAAIVNVFVVNVKLVRSH